MTALAQADIDLLVVAAVFGLAAIGCFIASYVPYVWRAMRGR